MQIDTRDFEAALKAWADAAGKDCADACNLGAKTLIIEAAKGTVKTTKGRIRAELNQVVRSKNGRSGPRKFLLAAKKGMTRAEIGLAAEKKVKARQRGAGYIAIAVKMAGKAFGLYKNLRAGRGWAADSTGKTATTRGLDAVATATVAVPSGAETKIPWEASMPAATARVLDWAAKNLAKSAARYSGR